MIKRILFTSITIFFIVGIGFGQGLHINNKTGGQGTGCPFVTYDFSFLTTSRLDDQVLSSLEFETNSNITVSDIEESIYPNNPNTFTCLVYEYNFTLILLCECDNSTQTFDEVTCLLNLALTYNGECFFSWLRPRIDLGCLLSNSGIQDPIYLDLIDDLSGDDPECLFVDEGLDLSGRSLDRADISSQASFIISPNPVLNLFIVESSLDIDRLQITDISGKTVKSVTSRSVVQRIDVSHLDSGMYFIIAESEGEVLRPMRFIKI